MTFYLIRKGDGAGDDGSLSMIFWEDADGKIQKEYNARPKVGVGIRVGSAFARTMRWQDYWTTTLITKILEDTPNKIKFETGNSTYEWGII